MSFANGEVVTAFVNGANVSTPTALVFYDASGTVRALKSNERFVIRSYHIVASAAAVITLFVDNDAGGDIDAGEVIIAVGTFGANGGISENGIEHPCKVGFTPKIDSSTTDVVYAVVRAEIFPA